MKTSAHVSAASRNSCQRVEWTVTCADSTRMEECVRIDLAFSQAHLTNHTTGKERPIGEVKFKL